MRKVILSLIISILVISSFFNISFAEFNFSDTSSDGNGEFTQFILEKENVTVGEIPAGVKDLYVKLNSPVDIDIQLYDIDNNKPLVAWKAGALISGKGYSKADYNGLIIEYSGYNGDGIGGRGNEYIKLTGTTKSKLKMTAFGYASGKASIKYTYTGSGLENSPTGGGTFNRFIAKDERVYIGTIPKNISDVYVVLSSINDLDIELYCGGDCVIGRKGLVDSPDLITKDYNNDSITWSGYSGNVPGKVTGKGSEYIHINNKTNNEYKMYAYGYEPGAVKINYTWKKDEPAGAVTPCNVSYTQVKSGTYLYCNNPEQLTLADLGDYDLGNKMLMQGYVKGNVQAFISHVNAAETKDSIYCAIQLLNPGPESVNVTVTNKGYAVGDWTGLECWKQFSQAIYNQHTIKPNESLWILKDDTRPIGYNKVVDGLVRFTVDGNVYANIYAYKDFNKINGSALYEGYITRTESNGGNETRVYKGISAFPMVAGNFSWVVDDSTAPGNLPVLCNYKLSDGWITNMTQDKLKDALSTDLISFVVPGYNDKIGPTTKDPSKKTCNLGNWGVHYTDRVTIANHGTKTRKIQLGMSAPISSFFVNVNTAFFTPDGFKYNVFNRSDKEYIIYEFSVPAGSTVEKEIQTVLAGHSYGGLYHFVRIAD